MAIALRKCLCFKSIFSNYKNPSSVFSTLLSTRSYVVGKPEVQEIVPDYSKLNDEVVNEVFSKVNHQITEKSHGRLFAVIYVQGCQFRITQEDIIVLRHNWAPTLGDVIRLEKVLLVGCADFTLIGRPLLPQDQVTVIGTVFEKTLSHTIPYLRYKARKNNLRQHFYKDILTYVRINSITLNGKVNELGDTDGLSDRIF